MDFSLLCHELECQWRPICCPDLICPVENVIFRNLDQHLMDCHKDLRPVKNHSSAVAKFIVKEFELSLDSGTWVPSQFSHYRAKNFLLMAVNNGRFYFWIYYHGSLENAQLYKCTIKVFGNCDVAYTFNGTVRSLDESKATIFNDENALVISACQARRLVSTERLKCTAQVTCGRHLEDGDE
jgi:hypothetical protein